MSRRHASINRTVQTAIVGFGLALAATLVSLLIVYAWVIEDNIFNRLVSSEADYIEQVYAEQTRIVQPRFPFMTLHAGWQEFPQNIQELQRKSPERVEFPTVEGGTLHSRSLMLGAQEWVLAADVTGFEVSRDYLPRLIPWITLVFVIVLLAAWLLSFYLGHSITQPLIQLADRFKRREASATAIELPENLPRNEIGYLAEVVKTSVDKLQNALRREADFTRDISHELRTPTTVLKLMSARLDTSRAPSEQQVKQLHDMVARIEETTTVLLALAREESVHTESLSLLAEIEACVVNHRKLAQQNDFALTIDVPAGIRVQANQNLLQLLLTNLLNNAVEHASAPVLEITLKDHEFSFRNPVASPPSGDVVAASVRSPSSQGLGQGLHLVKRICQLNGWQLATHSDAGEFVLSIRLSTMAA